MQRKPYETTNSRPGASVLVSEQTALVLSRYRAGHNFSRGRKLRISWAEAQLLRACARWGEAVNEH